MEWWIDGLLEHCNSINPTLQNFDIRVLNDSICEQLNSKEV